MENEKALAAFENFKIRRIYDEKSEVWCFSVVDIVAALLQQRMMGQETRNKLTDYWKEHEINGEGEYAILTNIIIRNGAGSRSRNTRTSEVCKPRICATT